jgi:hypothetical protein
LARRSGQSIHDKADAQWLFAGRPVNLFDGSTVVMPDTDANQAMYVIPAPFRSDTLEV